MTEQSEPFLPQRNIFHLLWGVLRQPQSTLAYIRDAPGRSWLFVGLMAVITMVLLVVTIAPISARVAREAMQAQFEAQSNATSQPIDPQTQQNIARFASNPLLTMVVPSITGLIGLILGWLLWTGALHLLSILSGGDSHFGSMWRAVVWSWLPFVLRNILQIGFVLVTGTPISNPGLSGLVAQETSVADFITSPPSAGSLALQALLSQIDIFVIWNIILLSIAVMMTARLARRKAVFITLAVWILFLGARMALVIVPTLFARGFA